MAVNSQERSNVNDPGLVDVDRPYYDSEQEAREKKKVPVEYLGHLAQQRKARMGFTFLWTVIFLIFIGIGPGIKGQYYSPRTGELRPHLTFVWGQFEYRGNPISTEWTEWYESMNPEPYTQHWVPYGKVHPAFFGIVSFPFGVKNLGWRMPENLVPRMKELNGLFRPGTVLDIPRTIDKVNNAKEWNAIILPLTVGTARDASEWWNQHKRVLIQWSEQDLGTPLPENYIEEAAAYVERMHEPNGNHIPLN